MIVTVDRKTTFCHDVKAGLIRLPALRNEEAFFTFRQDGSIVTPAHLAPCDQALFNTFALPGWVGAEEDAIRVVTCLDLAFPIEPAEANGFSVHVNEDQVITWVGIAQIGVFRAQAFDGGVAGILTRGVQVGVYRQHFWIVRLTLKMAGDQSFNLRGHS